MNRFSFTKRNKLSVFERFGGLDWSQIATLLDGWKDGQEGNLTATKIGKPKSPEQLGYYYGKILPMAFENFKTDHLSTLNFSLNSCKGESCMVELPMSKDAVDNMLKAKYAERFGVYMNKGEMDMAQCAAFENWAILWLGEHRNCHVPPSDPNWHKNKE